MFYGLNYLLCQILSMVWIGCGMCYVICFYKFFEFVIVELWFIIINNDVWDFIFGNCVLYLQVSDLSVVSFGYFDKQLIIGNKLFIWNFNIFILILDYGLEGSLFGISSFLGLVV